MSRLTESQRERILERDGYVCIYCFGEANCVDHIIPWSYAEDSSDGNLVASCTECNLIASDKVFSSLGGKCQYINEVRNHRRRHKETFSNCVDCGKNFRPRFNGSTIFLCKKCASKTYDPRRRKMPRTFIS